ncbi:hypothetical protein [Mycobacterium sp. M26]|uniref:hypothetical protein n=1 Tax=Mycobacterium sp. M26 TaxID=1762962 RepID=UPI00073EADE4|nr:hypothetical protein [Mycobacterium sp. M26]
MTHSVPIVKKARPAGVLAGVLACGALSVSALGTAPPAYATCASFFGLGNSAECKSGFGSIAIGIGPGATAWAEGLFSAALAIGTNSTVYTANTGVLQIGVALGDSAEAESYGALNIAIATGDDGAARAENGIANIALNLATQSSFTLAKGSLNIAVNLLGGQTGGTANTTVALGTANLAVNVNVLGDNKVEAGEYFPDVPAVGSVAVNLFGNGNTVTAGPGPLAIAGSIGQSGATVTKTGPGFNINGVRVFGAAAERSGAKKASASSGATKSGGSTGGSGRQRD